MFGSQKERVSQRSRLSTSFVWILGFLNLKPERTMRRPNQRALSGTLKSDPRIFKGMQGKSSLTLEGYIGNPVWVRLQGPSPSIIKGIHI